MKYDRLQSANNVPLHAPLIFDPFVPYHCPGNRSLSVYCKGSRPDLEKHLASTPFELASEVFLVYVSDFMNCDKVPFMDAGIMLAVRYKGRTGGYVLYEYEDDDGAMAAGRELWGYPKKFAEIELNASDRGAAAKVTRKGKTIFSLETVFAENAQPPSLTLTPHFNVKVSPGPDGSVSSRQVIERDTSPDFVTTKVQVGTGRAELLGSRTDPFFLLGDFEPLAASLTVGDFHATETNGWGKIVETL